MHPVLAIRNINTLKIIDTIGPRETTNRRLGDNCLNYIPEIDQQICIQGRQFVGFGENLQPQFIYPEPRYFRVVAVTPCGAYVKKWRDKDSKSALEKYLGIRR